MKTDKKVSKPLTWEQVADEYNKITTGRPAMTLEMDYVFNTLAENDQFVVDKEEGTIHKILEEE